MVKLEGAGSISVPLSSLVYCEFGLYSLYDYDFLLKACAKKVKISSHEF